MLRIYKKFKINVPKGAKYIIDTINNYGYKAYLIGGCIRDSILKLPVKDWDIVTDATPGQIESIFGSKCKAIGKAFGVIQVSFDDEHYEVATFREEKDYRDGRHPRVVHFVKSLKEDCLRRDFTINQLAYDVENNLIYDYFGGVKDIKRKMIRCVGHPQDRFNEDPLRMLRAIRFANKLNFKIDRKSLKVMFYKGVLLTEIPKERVTNEFLQILSHGFNIRYLYETQLDKYIFPRFSFNNFFVIIETTNILQETILSNKHLNNDELVSILLAILFYCIGYYKYNGDKKIYFDNAIDTLVHHFKLPNSTIKKTLMILDYINFQVEFTPYRVKKMASQCGLEVAYCVLVAMESIVRHTNDNISMFGAKNFNKSNILDACRMLNRIKTYNEPYLLKHLVINGNDIKGMIDDKHIGEILDECLEYVICDKSYNNRKDLLETIIPNIIYCKNLMKEGNL